MSARPSRCSTRAARRRDYGEDVVVGVRRDARPTRRPAAQVGDLEVVPRTEPRRTADGTFEEMDLDAVLARKPQVALVDELAHTNVPGSRNEKRWEDVEELLDAGISVISTINVQHLESLNDVVEQITGVKQRETIPDAVVRRADEIQLVDLTPLALRNRLARGDIYPPERIDTALATTSEPGTLTALRELALALARRSRRRGPRRLPGAARHRAALGDAGARPRRSDRIARRRAAHPARCPHRPARRRAISSESTSSRRTGSPRRPPHCSRGSESCSRSSTARTTRSSARTSAPRSSTPREAERDPDRHGREPSLEAGSA